MLIQVVICGELSLLLNKSSSLADVVESNENATSVQLNMYKIRYFCRGEPFVSDLVHFGVVVFQENGWTVKHITELEMTCKFLFFSHY